MFVFSKVVGVLSQPGNVLMLVLLAGVALLFSRRARLGRMVLAAVAVTAVLMAVLPWDEWLVGPLEDRFPAPRTLPDRIDGIVVLGGSVNPTVNAARGQPSLNAAAERLTAFVELARRHPEAKLVYTGGSGSVTDQELKEPPVARAVLESVGFDVSRVAFESQSRNTHENATMTHALVKPQAGEIWVLVTSASHMPRSVGAFRAVGWSIVPYPVDYTTTGQWAGSLSFNLTGGLVAVDAALHEWGGLAYYRLRGWTDSLYPSPEPMAAIMAAPPLRPQGRCGRVHFPHSREAAEVHDGTGTHA